MHSFSSSLADLRREISVLDDELLVLLNRRAAVSLEVGRLKGQSGDAVFQPGREREILDRLQAENASRNGALPSGHIVPIWREILASSRALQQTPHVAFLGPEGTFSHMAALECLGHSLEARPQATIRDVFRAVGDGACALGLVPLENSIQGSIGKSFDLFSEFRVHIAAEHYSRITLALMGRAPATDAVRRVCSHPQPLGQAGVWLRTSLPGIPLVPVESTAAAARLALEEPETAAIGHPDLASLLGLPILAENLEDSPLNRTRFAVIAPGAPSSPAGENLKTSILFTVPHVPGSLSRVLAVPADAGINLSKLESRPMPGAAWQYVFFADMACNLLLPAQAGVLAALRSACQSLRVLGVYPPG